MKVLNPATQPENQLWKQIGQYAQDLMEVQNHRRDSVTTHTQWEVLRRSKKEAFMRSFPPLLLEKCPLNARTVSSYTFEHYRIENVIFESIPGWEVNATLYLPKEQGIYPAVVCPTGSSSKSRTAYQRPCQIFARNGYIAVSIDPPGFAGERKFMNDCFVTGQTGFLTGIWCQANYIIDTLRVLDYLDTRFDVERSKGYAMSGLSLGGFITSLAGWMDDRIACIAPVCSVKSHLQNDIVERYTAQPSSWGIGFFTSGIDTADLLCMAAPKPCLIHAGRFDEVLDAESAEQVFKEVEHIYSLYGGEHNLELFIDDAPHEYSAKMAVKTVEWMNRLIAVAPRPFVPLTDKDIDYVDPEKLRCNPSCRMNYYTLNKREAEQLAVDRAVITKTPAKLASQVRKTLAITKTHDSVSVDTTLISNRLWVHSLYGVDMTLPEDIHIPGLLLKRINRETPIKFPAMLFLDENGKWEWLYKNGPLTAAARFLERSEDEREPMILSMDLSGWGELAPQPAAYELASWGDTMNSIAYIGLGADRPIIGLRVKEALAALEWLEHHPDVDPERLYIGGRGQGAIVALLTAFLHGKVKKVLCTEMLSHYGALAEDYPNNWQSDVMIPEVLKHYDLPDLAAACQADILMLNPLDGCRQPTSVEKVTMLYEEALRQGMRLHTKLTEEELKKTFINYIYE